MTIATTESTITDHEAAQIDRANATSATPVVFVHGLWLLPSSWDRWVTLFEEAGYVGVTPGWPDDPETVAEARERPEVFAGKGIREIADYEEAIIRRLDRKPVIIGHSFGGLLTMTQIHNPVHVVPIRDEVVPQFRRVIVQNLVDGREAGYEARVVGVLQHR